MQLVVGRVGRAHGIRGDVAVDVRTDDPDTRFRPGTVLATDPPGRGPLTVRAAHPHGGRMLLSFEGVTGRDDASALRGTLLLAEVDPEVRPVDPDEFYDHQLVGLAVVRVTGEPLGTVQEVLHLPGQDVLCVRDPDGEERLVPFVSELVPQVDPGAGRIVVDPPLGLFGTGP
ncbi:MAG: ribosome maturation factor RimM [Carbonactinosporaceae bacterium]